MSEGKLRIGTGLPGPGRPSIYTQEIADEICRRIADGESLRSICRDNHMPDDRTVRNWALDKEHVFYPQYARAREFAYHAMADDLLEIADDGRNDWMEKQGEDDAGWLANGEHLQRSRLRVDTRKWMLSKVLPKVYGDKMMHQGDPENPLQFEALLTKLTPSVFPKDDGEDS